MPKMGKKTRESRGESWEGSFGIANRYLAPSESRLDVVCHVILHPPMEATLLAVSSNAHNRVRRSGAGLGHVDRIHRNRFFASNLVSASRVKLCGKVVALCHAEDATVQRQVSWYLEVAPSHKAPTNALLHDLAPLEKVSLRHPTVLLARLADLDGVVL